MKFGIKEWSLIAVSGVFIISLITVIIVFRVNESKKPLKFAAISDLHWNAYYQADITNATFC
jgi:hypothetical protein